MRLNSIGVGGLLQSDELRADVWFSYCAPATCCSSLLIGIHLLLVRIRGIVRPYAPTIEEERTQEKRPGEAEAARSPRRLLAKPRPRPSDQISYYRGTTDDALRPHS